MFFRTGSQNTVAAWNRCFSLVFFRLSSLFIVQFWWMKWPFLVSVPISNTESASQHAPSLKSGRIHGGPSPASDMLKYCKDNKISSWVLPGIDFGDEASGPAESRHRNESLQHDVFHSHFQNVKVGHSRLVVSRARLQDDHPAAMTGRAELAVSNDWFQWWSALYALGIEFSFHCCWPLHLPDISYFSLAYNVVNKQIHLFTFVVVFFKSCDWKDQQPGSKDELVNLNVLVVCRFFNYPLSKECPAQDTCFLIGYCNLSPLSWVLMVCLI